jgi:hypothetical protein
VNPGSRGSAITRPATYRITKNGVPITVSSSHSAIVSGTGTSLLRRAVITRYSRSTWCAEGSSLPGGFLRSTSRSAPRSITKVGFDCPPSNCATRSGTQPPSC